MMIDGVAALYNIAVSRLTCSMLSLSKRAISDGQAQVLIGEPGQANSSSAGVAPWVVAVAVVGGIIAVLALAAVIYFLLIYKKGPTDENWEKY